VSGSLGGRFLRGRKYRVGADVEFLVDVGDLAGGAEAGHADEAAADADVTLPAGFDGRFYCDARAGRAEYRFLKAGVLFLARSSTTYF
jgi:hypothetical protein